MEKLSYKTLIDEYFSSKMALSKDEDDSTPALMQLTHTMRTVQPKRMLRWTADKQKKCMHKLYFFDSFGVCLVQMKRQNFQRPCVKGVTNTFCDDRNDETRIKARLPVLVQSQQLRSLQPLHVPGRCCNFLSCSWFRFSCCLSNFSFPA